MEITITEFEFFKSLMEFDNAGKSFDLHNNFTCTRIQFEENTICLHFTETSSGNKLIVTLTEIEIVKFDFSLADIEKYLTIDLFYRGRYVQDDVLLDVKNDKGYIFLEFYEDVAFEFFAKKLLIEYKG